MSRNGLRHKVMVIFLIMVCVYVALAAILFIFQSRLIYFPQREINSTPHEVGLKYEAIDFESKDRIQLSGWFVPAVKARAVLLFCHGNAGNISDRLQFIQMFHKLDVSTFIFDYRGYGQSQGTPSERGTYLDAEAAWEYLTMERDIPEDRIVVLGKSLGGPIAARLAGGHKPAGLIIESSFTSVPDLGAQLYPFLPVRLLARFKYPTERYLTRVNCPVLIVHSCDDEVVPYSQACRLYEKANEPKEFLEIRGDHNGGAILSSETYIAGLNKFITKFIDSKSPHEQIRSGRTVEH